MWDRLGGVMGDNANLVIGALSATQRRAALARMTQTSGEPLDVLVIGGGITGAGIALDAAARGYRVGLVEREDYASGTSSRSTKLIHGGIRYLPQLDISLVREGLHERGRLLRNAPHLARPLAFVLPLYASSRHPVGIRIAPPFGIGLGIFLAIGLTLYDRLAGSLKIAPHRRLSRSQTEQRARSLTPKGLRTGFVYYDAQTDDARLTLAVLRSAAERGALLANYAEATAFARENGSIVGAYIRETLPGAASEPRLIRARHVINATGVWAEQTERLAGDEAELRIAPSKGTHLVFTKETLGLGDEAIVLPETQDGRIIFVVPWLSRALVGTTDDEAPRIENPVATDGEIDYLLAHLNRYLRRPVSRADILATYAGYRPLVRRRSAAPSGKLSRSHEIVESPEGLLTISGGKLTSYRQMAEDMVDRIDAREGREVMHPTRELRLHGAIGWPEARLGLYERGQQLGLAPEIIEHLAAAHGSEAPVVLDLIATDASLAQPLVAGLPYIRAEVAHATRAEGALTLQDVLARRTRIAIEERSRGTAAAGVVADLMAANLGWSTAENARRLLTYDAWAREQAGPLADEMPATMAAARLDERAVDERTVNE